MEESSDSFKSENKEANKNKYSMHVFFKELFFLHIFAVLSLPSTSCLHGQGAIKQIVGMHGQEEGGG